MYLFRGFLACQKIKSSDRTAGFRCRIRCRNLCGALTPSESFMPDQYLSDGPQVPQGPERKRLLFRRRKFRDKATRCSFWNISEFRSRVRHLVVRIIRWIGTNLHSFASIFTQLYANRYSGIAGRAGSCDPGDET